MEMLSKICERMLWKNRSDEWRKKGRNKQKEREFVAGARVRYNQHISWPNHNRAAAATTTTCRSNNDNNNMPQHHHQQQHAATIGEQRGGQLAHDGHSSRDSHAFGVLWPPELSDRLKLRIELHALPAIEVRVTQEGPSRASKREHRQRNRNWHLYEPGHSKAR